MIPLDEDGNEQFWAGKRPDDLQRQITSAKNAYAYAAIAAIKAFGVQPDSYAWRCWWETQ